MDPDGRLSDRGHRKLAVTVVAAALAGLMLELLLARIFPVLLGNVSAFLAVPVAMLGLSLGALALHLRRTDPAPETLPGLLVLLAIAVPVSLIAQFALFDFAFELSPHTRQLPSNDALKVVVLTAAVLPPFALIGVLLSTAFSVGADRIGRLYALDLVGSGAACLITPLALRAVDLPVVVAMLTIVPAVAVFHVLDGRRAVRVAAVVLGAASLAAASTGGLYDIRLDPEILGKHHRRDDLPVQELGHRWNDVSRLTLLQAERSRGGPVWVVMHDDGISNVYVRRFRPQRRMDPADPAYAWGLPFVLDHEPRKVLVMFAGAARDMVRMHERAAGRLELLRGVELNGAIRGLVEDDRRWNLGAFFALPEVEWIAAEGRGFLSRDETVYDVIFAASNSPVELARTGHSRKYLDTVEALHEYLDQLADGGVLLFNSQRIEGKVEALKRIHAVRSPGVPFEDCVALFSRGKVSRKLDLLLYKPSGLSPGELARIDDGWGGDHGSLRAKYLPGRSLDAATSPLVVDPIRPEIRVETDDRPTWRLVEFGRLPLLPTEAHFKDQSLVLDWTKAFTAVLYTVVALGLALVFGLRRRGGRRLRAWHVGYLYLTGAAYITAQLALMAKLELFLGSPLAAISVVLASFLVANGAGSAWVGGRRAAGRPVPVAVLAAGAAIATGLTIVGIDAMPSSWLAFPAAVKAAMGLLLVAPMAFLLGTFYPTLVGLATREGLHALVPATFGLATASSVLAGPWALIFAINLGFRALSFTAVAAYLLLTLAAMPALLSARRA